MKLAILVLSRNGLKLARRLRNARSDKVSIYGPSCVVGPCGGPETVAVPERPGLAPRVFETAEPGVFGWIGPLRRVVPTIWDEADAIVAVMALGIVVRLAGSLAKDKRTDPAVVVVDDAGRFAVSVLGGHAAGANDLANEVAEALGAVPVVTTASEAQGLPAVDRIGHDEGWIIERAENLTRVAACVVRRQVVAVWQDAGSPDWWRSFGAWPAHFVRFGSWTDLTSSGAAAMLVISDRVVPAGLPEDRTLVYRPPTLVAGIGCRRGTSLATLETWVDHVFTAQGLAERSLAALATVTLKVDEPGLIAFAASRGLPLIAFPPDQLANQPGIETPSERVRSKIGIAAVAEPAALRASGASTLLVAKQKGPGVTLAIARKPGPNPASYHAYVEGGPNPGA